MSNNNAAHLYPYNISCIPFLLYSNSYKNRTKITALNVMGLYEIKLFYFVLCRVYLPYMLIYIKIIKLKY